MLIMLITANIYLAQILCQASLSVFLMLSHLIITATYEIGTIIFILQMNRVRHGKDL